MGAAVMEELLVAALAHMRALSARERYERAAARLPDAKRGIRPGDPPAWR
jgi:hypothetical protein